jgi:hypothetical protein
MAIILYYTGCLKNVPLGPWGPALKQEIALVDLVPRSRDIYFETPCIVHNIIKLSPEIFPSILF